MSGARVNQLLKGVSRSFYLTLRLLPHPMRQAASLGYLLARTSDTLADASAVPVEVRLASLDAFAFALAGSGTRPCWEPLIHKHIADPREQVLLGNTESIFAWLDRMPEKEASLIREVVGIIIGGQKLDVLRFREANGSVPTSLHDDAELEDYIWRVAGCVGAFWTKLGFLTLGDSFSRRSPEELIEMGIAYGKGLQLVNILRDMSEDFAAGRCYLPLPDPPEKSSLMRERARWMARAMRHVDEGFAYAEALASRRLRAASALPAMLARATLHLLEQAGAEALQTRVKVPRRRVYLLLMRAFTSL